MARPGPGKDREARSRSPGSCGNPWSLPKRSPPSGFQAWSFGQAALWALSESGPPELGVTMPPSNRAMKFASSFIWALSIASPVITTSCTGLPPTGACSIPLTAWTMALIACELSDSCGRCMVSSSRNRGSPANWFRNSKRAGDSTSVTCRSETCAIVGSERTCRPTALPGGPVRSVRTEWGSPSPSTSERNAPVLPLRNTRPGTTLRSTVSNGKRLRLDRGFLVAGDQHRIRAQGQQHTGAGGVRRRFRRRHLCKHDLIAKVDRDAARGAEERHGDDRAGQRPVRSSVGFEAHGFRADQRGRRTVACIGLDQRQAHAPDLHLTILDAALQLVGEPHELGDEGRCGPGVDRGRRPELLQPALVHDPDPVGDGQGLLLIVRDEQRRDADFELHAADLIPQPGPNL